MVEKKITISWYVNESLIQRIDSERRKRSMKEKKDVNRSMYLNELILKGLGESNA
jgi:hypothetical protein